MKIRFFFLLVTVLVLNTGQLTACGKKDLSSSDSTEKSCCSGNETDSTASSCDTGTEQHKDTSGCPCSEDSNDCHCPGCGHSGSFFFGGVVITNDVITTTFIPGTSEQQQAFYFNDHLPEAVYLPIWQPPKIV